VRSCSYKVCKAGAVFLVTDGIIPPEDLEKMLLVMFNLIGRPRGPRMLCGWRCGALLTEHEMRAHFTVCPKRPASGN
jgi:hypothetical protein